MDGESSPVSGESSENLAEGAQSLSDFFEGNHELFTVISVFGALAVYLTQFQESLTEFSRLGVGSVLILFLLGTLIALKETNSEFEKAKGNDQMRLIIGYGIITYSFIMLTFSISAIMMNSFPEGSGTVLFSGLLYGGAFVYLRGVMTNDFFTEIESKNVLLEFGLQRSPFLALAIFASYYWYLYQQGDAPPIIQENLWRATGAIIGAIIIHIVLLFVIYKTPRMIEKRVTAHTSNSD